MVEDAELLDIIRDRIEADRRPDARGDEVERFRQARQKRYRAVELALVIRRIPLRQTGPLIEDERSIEHDRRWREAVIERRQIDEGLDCRAGLAHRLGGAIKLAHLVAEAAIEREHAARVRIHRDERPR